MASSTRNDKHNSNRSTTSGPSSLPPIPIKPSKAKTNSVVPTPPHSHETNPKTPETIHRPDYREFGVYLPPTPGDALSQKAQRMSNPTVSTSAADRTQRIINHLIVHNSTGNILDELDEDVLMDLRSSIDHTFTFPFRIDQKSFHEWDRRLSDSGGYGYDAENEKLIIKIEPSAIHEGYNLKGRGSKGRYAGTSIPNCAISLKDGPVTIVIEIGVTQPLEALRSCAEKWLLEKGVQLVILVDIDVKYHELQLSFDSFSSTYESEGGTRSSLPYDLEITDYRDGDFESVGLKILQWYASHEPAIQLVQPQTITMYLYRHYKEDKSKIHEDHRTVAFDLEHGFIDAEVHITSNDFGIPSNIISKEIKLPLDDLRAEFPSILAEHSKDIAERKAIKLLKIENDSDYEPSPQVDSSSAQPAFTKPSTRSSNRPKHTTESPVEATTSSQKKRKRNSPRAEESGMSFGSGQNPSFGSTSSPIFAYEFDEEIQGLVHSNEVSFSGPSAAIQQRIAGLPSSALMDSESSGEKISRRRSKRGKAKRT